MLSSFAIIQILIRILFDIIIFYILYSKINSCNKYLKNVVIYTLGMGLKVIVSTGIIVKPILLVLLWKYLLVTFIIYFVFGLALIFILDRLCSNSCIDRLTFIVISVLMQLGIISLLNLFI